MSRSPRGPSSFLALAALSLLVMGLPLARGGVDTPALIAAVLLASLAAALALWVREELPAAATWLLGAVLAFQVLQLVPVPVAWHGLSGPAARVYQISLQPLGLYPAARPFSLDPPSAAGRLAEGVACFAAYLAAWSYSDTHQRLRLLCSAVALSGVALAAFVLGAAVLGLGPAVEPRLPFVNPNHLAAATHLGAFACLGLAFHLHGQARVLWLTGFALVAAVGVLSLSRTGMAASLFGLVLFAALLTRRDVEGSRRRPEGHGRDPRRLNAAFLPTTLAVGAALGAALYLASDALVSELRSVPRVLEEAKPQLWRASLELVRDSPWVGIGRGSFATVFTGYKSDIAAVTYTHAENEWLQAVIDLGVPVGALLICGLGWLWLSAALRNARGALQIGLLAATAAVAVHDLADFSLEVPGVAIPFFVCLGALGKGAQPLRVPRTWLLAGASIAAVVAVFGAAWGAPRLTRTVEALGLRPDEVIAAARSDLTLHPADFLPHAMAGAVLAAQDDCPAATPWLERAMLLNPTEPRTHRFMGRCLWSSRYREGAAREYRLAIAYGDVDALDEVIRRFPSLEELLTAIPDTPDERLRVGQALLARRPADAAEILQRLVDEDLDDRAILPLARARLAAGEYQRALSLARQIIDARVALKEGYLLGYYSLVGLGRDSDGGQLLIQAAQVLPGEPELLTILAQRSIAARRFTEAKRLAEQIVPRSDVESARRELLVAHALAAQGRLPEAIERAQSAAADLPESPEPLMVLGQLLGTARRYEGAIDAWERAAALPGANVEACRRAIAELRISARERDAELPVPLP